MTQAGSTVRWSNSSVPKIALLVALAGWLSVSPGCVCAYVGSVLSGQLDLLANLQPVEQVLAGDGLSDATKDRLRYALAARSYAIEVVGLNVGRTYTQFYDTDGQPLAYNISACPPDRFEPLTWSFPIAGSFEYLGFFDRTAAEQFRDALIAAGYDIFFYEVDAYSTAAFVDDPIYSTMLNRDDIGLADLVFHELTHRTIYRVNDTQFNESVATFIGRAAAVRFLTDRFGSDSQIVTDARARFADEDLFTEFIEQLYADLADYYNGGLTLQQKIAGREHVIDAARQYFVDDYLPLLSEPQFYSGILTADINNALILAYRRYHKRLDVFDRLYDQLAGNFPRILNVLAQASQADDPYAFVSQWLGQQ